MEADEEEELLLQQAILDYKKETLADFQIQKTTNGLFLFTNLKTVSRMTGNFRHCGLSHYLQKRLRFCTYVAYGVAPELSTAKSSALEAVSYTHLIGPALGVFIVMVGLMASIGGPMAWLRLSIIGAAATELSAANIGAEACGVTLGTEQYTLICLAVSWFTMALNGAGWLLFTGVEMCIRDSP